MRPEASPLRGVTLLHGAVQEDDRGSFRRVVDVKVLAEHGLETGVDQVSVATNRLRGTVRGLHYQVEPHAEAKTLWCSAGSLFDVLVDLRPEEPTYGTHWSVVLTAQQPVALHVPRGIAHGYQTLSDATEVTYLIGTPYDAASARSLHWQDPHLAIRWPLPVTALSDRDRDAPPWPPSR